MSTVIVKIADMAVLKGRGSLLTVGLGSCVGVALYDPWVKVGGLAHIFLPDSKDFRIQGNFFNKAKFADTAIPLLVEKTESFGGQKRRLQAIIAGGSQLFSFQKANMSVGEKNVMAVKQALQAMNIPIRGEDVRGDHGRTMRFFISSGRVFISTVGKGKKEL